MTTEEQRSLIEYKILRMVKDGFSPEQAFVAIAMYGYDMEEVVSVMKEMVLNRMKTNILNQFIGEEVPDGKQ